LCILWKKNWFSSLGFALSVIGSAYGYYNWPAYLMSLPRQLQYPYENPRTARDSNPEPIAAHRRFILCAIPLDGGTRQQTSTLFLVVQPENETSCVLPVCQADLHLHLCTSYFFCYLKAYNVLKLKINYFSTWFTVPDYLYIWLVIIFY
jgi:hypothetical protein